jgi:hypothetical protein
MRCEGRWTWTEYQPAFEISYSLIATVDHQVDIIVHIAEQIAVQPPSGIFTQWRRYMERAPQHRGHVIMTPSHLFVRHFVQTFKNLFEAYQDKLHVADSLDAARLLSQQLREVP